MISHLSLLDPKLLDRDFLLAAQQRAVDQLIANVDALSSVGGDTVQQAQNPNHVISLMGERGTGKTTVLLNLIETLRQKREWLVPPIFLPDLVTHKEALGPAIVSLIQDALLEEPAAKDQAVRDEIESISLRLAWFPDRISQEVIAREAINSRDFARQSFKLYQDSRQISVSFKSWLSSLLKKMNRKNLILVFDDADISIENVEHILDFVRYFLSIPEVITIFSADEESLNRRLVNSRLAALDILSSLPESEGFSLFGMSGQDYKRREVEQEIDYVNALLTKVIPPATRVYIDRLSINERLNHKFRLPGNKPLPSTVELLSSVLVGPASGDEAKRLSEIAARYPAIFASNLRAFVNQYAMIYDAIQSYNNQAEAPAARDLEDTSEFSEIIQIPMSHGPRAMPVKALISQLLQIFFQSPVHRQWIQLSARRFERDVVTTKNLDKMIEAMVLPLQISGSTNFHVAYSFSDVRANEPELAQVFSFCVDIAVAGGVSLETMLFEIGFNKNEPIREAALGANIADAIRTSIQDLSSNLKFYESAASSDAVAAVSLDPTGGALTPFYVTNMAEFGVFIHTVWHSSDLRRDRESQQGHFEALRRLKRNRRSLTLALERRHLYQLIASLALQAFNYIAALIRIVIDRHNNGPLINRFRLGINTRLDWRITIFSDFWEVLAIIFNSTTIELGRKLAFAIALSELPYELMAHLSDRSSVAGQQTAKEAFANFKADLARRELYVAAEGFKFEHLREVSRTAPELADFKQYCENWPSLVWAANEAGLGRMFDFLESYELDTAWDKNISPPPKWRAFVERVVDAIQLEDETGENADGDADDVDDI